MVQLHLLGLTKSRIDEIIYQPEAGGNYTI